MQWTRYGMIMGLYMTQFAPLGGTGHPLYKRGDAVTASEASTTCTTQGVPTPANPDVYPTVAPAVTPTGVVRDGEHTPGVTPVYSAISPVTNTAGGNSGGGTATTPTLTPTETGGGPKTESTSASSAYNTVAPPSNSAPEPEGPRYTVTVAPPAPTAPSAGSSDDEECDDGENTGRDGSGTNTETTVADAGCTDAGGQFPADEECATEAPADDCVDDSDDAADECKEHPTEPEHPSMTPETSPTSNPTPPKTTTISVTLPVDATPVYPTVAPITDTSAATPASAPVETGVAITAPSNVYGTVAPPSA